MFLFQLQTFPNSGLDVQPVESDLACSLEPRPGNPTGENISSGNRAEMEEWHLAAISTALMAGVSHEARRFWADHKLFVGKWPRNHLAWLVRSTGGAGA